MFQKILERFGVVRTFVLAVVLAAVAVALNTAGFGVLVIGGVLVLISGVAWVAPFGSKYRKNF